jgi:hypothetical protein
MRSAPGPESVREPEEVLLVDRVQHRNRRPLDDLVLQSGNCERALPTVRLGYVDPPRRQRPIGSPMDPCMQILKIALKVCLIVPPCQTVHSRCRVLLEFEERLFEVHGAEVVEERGELLLCLAACRMRSSACDTLARFCARSVLCWLAFPLASALGSAGSAADRSASFVGFTATMAESDSPRPCIIGFGSSPSRGGPERHIAAGRSWGLPVPVQGASAHARVSDHAEWPRRSR